MLLLLILFLRNPQDSSSPYFIPYLYLLSPTRETISLSNIIIFIHLLNLKHTQKKFQNYYTQISTSKIQDFLAFSIFRISFTESIQFKLYLKRFNSLFPPLSDYVTNLINMFVSVHIQLQGVYHLCFTCKNVVV